MQSKIKLCVRENENWAHDMEVRVQFCSMLLVPTIENVEKFVSGCVLVVFVFCFPRKIWYHK